MVVVLTRIQEVLILSLVDNRILEPLLLIVVDEDVPHDGVQPPFNVGPLFEVVLVPQCLDEGLLDQIIGVFTITGKTHGETRKEILMRGQEVVEFDGGHCVQR